MITKASWGSKLGAGATFMLKKLWTLFAIALVLLALIMSLLRYSLPFLNDNKEYLENYISREYSIELAIGELFASWQNDGPAIVLRNVSIKNGDQSPLVLNIEEVFLEIDFWASIVSGKVQSNKVSLNELALDIDLTRMKTANSDFPISDFPIIAALENIFLEQLSNFEVSNSRLSLISQENNQVIDITKLSWLNQDNRHQGVGEFTLQDFSSNSARFILDLYGNVDSYSGTLFAKAQDINLSSWINEFTGLEGKLVSSKGNLEVWANIKNGELQRIDGQILPTTFEWVTKESTLSNSINARFAGIKDEEKWDFSIADLHIQTQGNDFKSDIHGHFSPQQGAVFRLEQALSLKPLLPLTSLFSSALGETLVKADADATLFELSALVDQSGLSLQAEIQDMHWQEYNKLPGFNNLQASIFWQGKSGKVALSSQDSLLASQYYFSRSVPVKALNLPLHINLVKDQGAISLAIKDGTALVDELALLVNTQYASANKFLSLAIDVEPFALAKIPGLLPKHLMGNGTRRFLQNAFVGKGRANDADIIWHGVLSNFPFTDNSGVFQSSVAIEQADFSFSKGWPALTKLDIDLLFENKSLNMKGQRGLLDKVALTNLQANIDELDANALLTIIADGAASSADITSLMLQSSLAASLGQLLHKDVLVDGDLSTQLALYIPLNDGAKTRVKGEVYLDNNKVSIPAINLAFNNTKGLLSFDNETIRINAMKATLFDQAVSIDISGKQSKDKYSLSADMTGNWQAPLLAQNINAELAALFEGRSDWQFNLGLDLMAKNFTYDAKLTSSLVGIEAKLPKPFAKTAQRNLPLILNASGDRIASSITLSLGDIAYFEGALAHQEKQFNRAHLSLGSVPEGNRGLGFSITANLDRIIAQDWYPFINTLTSGVDPQKINLLGVPERIFINTPKLIVAGEILSNANINIRRLTDQWSFDVNANELKANVSLFDDRDGKGLVVDAEYVRIAKASIKNEEIEVEGLDEQDTVIDQFKLEPQSLPRINFTCKACDIKGINFGEIAFSAAPNSKGLKISSLKFNNEFGSVNTSGQWYKRNQDHYTFMAGDVTSKDFGAFVSKLGFDAGIKDSSANMSFALTWKDSPMDIAFANLDGQLDWSLSDGSLTELSDQGSRIFTLLSLNSLVRKLSLDFRDVFARGFFYDNMKGSIQIAQGIADTRDTFIDGAAGEIEIYGNTNLTTQVLNYNVSFAPNVTGNLPVLVYFFTVSPPTALAALALDQVLTSAKVISNINYSITGTISQPILVETGRQSTEVELPANIEAIPSGNLPPFAPPTNEGLTDLQEQGG